MENWTTEVFAVVKVDKTLPPTFQLQDYSERPIAGSLYSEKMSKINYPHDYLIEKIIRRNDNKVFFKWLGFDTTPNIWIKASDITK